MFSLFGGSSQASAPAQSSGRAMPSANITSAIAEGARRSGVDFDYMLKTAQRESAFNPTAKASTSSARGLYQFIDQTWLAMVKQEGEKLGLGAYADTISKGADGRYAVEDAAMRKEILDLRNDPQLSATLAGAFTLRNANDLRAAIGRNPTQGELYMAHVLGATGAAKLVNATRNAPNQSGAKLFPEAASANRNLFYHRSGAAKSVVEVYAGLSAHHKAEPSVVAPASSVALAVQAQQEVQGSVSDKFMPFARKSTQPPAMFARTSPISPLMQNVAERQMAFMGHLAVPSIKPSGPLDLNLYRVT